jgi:ubiquinone/menaquinone biosynthesis C-methylase UbiE
VRADRLLRLFKQDALADYDFSQSPELVTRSTGSVNLDFSNSELARWEKAQESFLRWTTQKSMFTPEAIELDGNIYRRFFDKRGLFTGNVLDVGGGWGLKREWWNPANSDIYVVHDPGVARFLNGPYEYHYEYYKRGIRLPMSFVEGLGEELPYIDNSFDVCLIAATLDHVIIPEKLLMECYRCLKPLANLILIQSTKIPPKSFVRSLRSSAVKICLSLYGRLISADHHLNTFFLDDLVSLLSQNFNITTVRRIDDLKSIYAIEARTNIA